MSYRTLALVSSLLLAAGCGGAAPAKPAEAPPGPGATANADPTTRGTDKDAEAPKQGATEVSAAQPGAAAGGAPPPGKAAVDNKEPLGGGVLTQDDIRKILEANGEVFGDCYTLGAGGKAKEFKATVTVKATLGPSGNANAVQVLKSTAKNAKVDACVSEAFKKIKFPAPKNAATSVITFPIKFGAMEEVKQ